MTKLPCTVGFVNCLLKVPLACLDCRVQVPQFNVSLRKLTVRVILSLTKIEFKLKKKDLATHLRLIAGASPAVLEVDAGAVPLHVAHVGGVLVLLLQ